MADEAIDLAKLVKVYRKIRDKRAADKKVWEAADAALAAQQDEVGNFLLATLNQSNVKSMRTEAGTFTRTEKVIPAGADWGAFHRWIAEDPDRFEFLERRIKSTTVAAFMEENDGALPPGVNVFRQFTIGVRKPNEVE